MSRSNRAWMERQTSFEEHTPLGSGLLVNAVFSTKRLVGFLVASMLVIALAPASALAASAGGLQAESSTNHSNGSSARIQADAVVLDLGTGYSVPNGASTVRALQRQLTRAGDSPGSIDGRYGPRTEQAVLRFQAAHGLVTDGIAGPVTLAALSSGSRGLYPGTGYSGQGLGSVRALQNRLVRAGYSPGPIDGRYGPLTQQAVSRFQAGHGLRANGIATAQTLVLIGIQGKPQQATGRSSSPVSNQPTHQQTNQPTSIGPSGAEVTAPAGRAPVTKNVVSTTRSSSPSLALVALLVALVAALGLSAVWLANKRRRKRYAGVDPKANGAPHPGRHDVGDDQPNQTPTISQTTAPNAATANSATAANGTTAANGATAPNGAAAHKDTPTNHDRGEAKDAEHAFNQALLLEEKGDQMGAIAAYQRADRLGHGAAAANLGVLLEQHGEVAAAEGCYQRADKRGDANGSFNLAVLLEERGELGRAMAAYQRADRLGHGAAAANLGVLLEQRGDRAAAEACYRRADKRGDANGSFNLAVALEEQGDHLGALTAYQRAGLIGHPEIAEMARAAARDLTTQSKSPTPAGNGGGPRGS